MEGARVVAGRSRDAVGDDAGALGVGVGQNDDELVTTEAGDSCR